MQRLLFAIWIFALSPLSAFGEIRINAEGFHASEREIRAVLEAVIGVFPEEKLPPIFITRSYQGPITLYEKNLRGEIVIQLDTAGTYWAQYIYQFAHELTHVRTQLRPDGQDNKWFEETLCEVASLYALRKLSITWRDHPPFESWRPYRNKLHDYAQKVMQSRIDIPLDDLPAFYLKHREALRSSAKNRQLNGSIAKALLPFFEEDPARWKTLNFLNKSPAQPGLSLPLYFKKWKNDAPRKYWPLMTQLFSHLDVTLE